MLCSMDEHLHAPRDVTCHRPGLGCCDAECLCLAGVDERRLGRTLERRSPPRLPVRSRRDALAASDVGRLLLFDFNNIRYVTSTHIGEWARDKMTRYALQTRGGEPTSGTSGRRPSTTGATARGCARRTSTPGWSACAAPIAPDAACSVPRRGDPRHPGGRGRGRHAARRRYRRAADAGGARGRGHHRPGWTADHARRPRDQVGRRDHAAQRRLLDGRRRLPADLRAAQAGDPRERARRRRHEVPVRSRIGARRQHQRRLGRALQPASTRVQRPDHPPGRPGILRHHPYVHGLQDLLLPHVRGRQGQRCPARRI